MELEKGPLKRAVVYKGSFVRLYILSESRYALPNQLSLSIFIPSLLVLSLSLSVYISMHVYMIRICMYVCICMSMCICSISICNPPYKCAPGCDILGPGPFHRRGEACLRTKLRIASWAVPLGNPAALYRI